MGFFNNLFNINEKSNFSVSGLNKELNSIYINEYFMNNDKGVLVVCNSLYEANDLYNRINNYTRNGWCNW